jgi:hypothetical protein
MRQYNTKSAKLSLAQVREMYGRLRRHEMTQGEAALEYGLSVIQVGRIARGESRAQETGARDDRIPNLNQIANMESAAEASAREFKRRFGGEEAQADKPAPSLYNDPPPPGYDDADPSAADRLTTDIAQHPTTQTSEALGELLTVDSTQKGDRK